MGGRNAKNTLFDKIKQMYSKLFLFLFELNPTADTLIA